jgi:predicted Zn-dependent peptidase
MNAVTWERALQEELRNIRRTSLPNGLTIVSEQMPHLRSISIGIWIRTGSRDESPEVNGISHFLEHMVFKGTRNRSAEDIARHVDSIGGNLDAFTAKECVCFNIKVLDEHLPQAVDVLSDLVLGPVFAEEDIKKERGVILEEIKMDEDNPDYLVHEIFTQNFWKDQPLGKPILGTKETVRKFDRASMLEAYNKRFTPGNMIISAAGNVDHDHFVALISKEFEKLEPGKNGFHSERPTTHPRIMMRNKKSLEQVQICIGVPSYPISHERRYSSYVMNTLLGGGMSSRLFQNVREKQGLVYAIFSELNPFRDTGCLAIYAGTSRDSVPKVVASVISEFKKVKHQMVDQEELDRAKAQLKGNLMLSLESSTARMSNLARQEMYYDHFFGMNEIIQRIEAIQPEDVLAVSNEFFKPESIAVTVLGNLNGLKLSRDLLEC